MAVFAGGDGDRKFGRVAQEPSKAETPKPDAAKASAKKSADLSKPVQVFILLGQSNMVGMGKITGGEGSLEHAVKEKKKYPYLVDEAGNWTERKDVRFVRVMQGRGGVDAAVQQRMDDRGQMRDDRPGVRPRALRGECHRCAGDDPQELHRQPQPRLGSAAARQRALQAEVTERNGQKVTKVFAGYKDRPDSWVMDPSKGTATEPPPWLDKNGKPIDWYAGKQYDDDIADAKKVLAELDKYYPGATGVRGRGLLLLAGREGLRQRRACGRYEQNLVRFIKQLRKDFNAPNAKFVLATLGESTKGSGGNGGMVLEAHLAVDGNSGKYPEFKGNVATVYSNPMAQGGSGNGHYGGKAEVYMDVGEAMGKAMVELLKDKK